METVIKRLNEWGEFNNEIKLNNRFFIKKLIELDLLFELIKKLFDYVMLRRKVLLEFKT